VRPLVEADSSVSDLLRNHMPAGKLTALDRQPLGQIETKMCSDCLFKLANQK
jgi:hypothetical protein